MGVITEAIQIGIKVNQPNSMEWVGMALFQWNVGIRKAVD